jgi:peroxiredoxin Q/BCP
VLSGPPNNLARRWTFYIGKNGKILEVDKTVKPVTAGKDVAATLERLGVAKKK